MKHIIKVLYVSAEISTYASAGGLGEVGNSLPKALIETGNVEVRRVMPLYKQVNKKLKYLTDFPVSMENSFETCVVKTDPEEKEIPTYFIGNDRYYYRDNIYAYEDDGFRFLFFCKAVAKMLSHIHYKPDIIHVNDWHTGLLPLLIKAEYPKMKTVFTIHNVAYHGFVPYSYLSDVLSKEKAEELGYPDWINFMKAGIVYSDLLTTVSPGYKGEILSPDKGFGMDSLIKLRTGNFVGILNGIETIQYDPKRKDSLQYPYDQNCLDLKKKNRSLLRKEYGLPDTDIPLLAMVTRLTYSKGIDLLFKAISYSDLDTFQLIILGSGDPYYQGMLEELARGYQGEIVFEKQYSVELAMRIYAAADIYLMPSLYEPCGLGQLYAMRYGAVPIVHPVGGLKDTVVYNKKNRASSSGFYLEDWTGTAFKKTIRKAVKAYGSGNWIKMMKNAMNYDSSWQRSVKEYISCYQDLISK